MKWHEGLKSLSQWHVGTDSIFSGTEVITNFFNGIQVKLSTSCLFNVSLPSWAILELGLIWANCWLTTMH
jgi:hypothetical protein